MREDCPEGANPCSGNLYLLMSYGSRIRVYHVRIYLPLGRFRSGMFDPSKKLKNSSDPSGEFFNFST